jgi:hypothetical protein
LSTSFNGTWSGSIADAKDDRPLSPEERDMRTKREVLDDSINVPVPAALKRRVVRLAKRRAEPLKHTAYARELIERGVEQDERNVAEPELAAAGK